MKMQELREELEGEVRVALENKLRERLTSMIQESVVKEIEERVRQEVSILIADIMFIVDLIFRSGFAAACCADASDPTQRSKVGRRE